MDPLKRKKIARGVLRSHCKTVEGKIIALVDNGEYFPKAVELKSLKMSYEDKIAKINIVTNEIQELITDEDALEHEISDAIRESEIYYETLSKIEESLSRITVSCIFSFAMEFSNLSLFTLEC